MKKLFSTIFILSYLSCFNLFSSDWEWVNKDKNGNIIGSTTEFKILKGEMWLSTTTDIYRYENGMFVSKDASPVVEELFFCGLRSLTLDKRGNLIGRNNNGIAWYDGKEWTVLGATDINYIQFNRGITLTPNDTLVLALATQEIVKFAWDIAKEKYKQLPNEKLILPKGETRIGTGGALILEINEPHKALFSNNTTLNLLEISSGIVENVNDRLQFDTSNVKEFYGFFDSGLSYYFNYINKDSSASLLVMSKDFLYPALHLTFRNPDWDITQITSVVDYNNNGLFYALGDKLYFTNLSDTILIPKPKILGDDIDNMWYITTMDIDENDTLWVGTLSSGLFKAFVPDLLTISSVEYPEKQWGLSELLITKTYPNPNNGEFLNIELYVANDNMKNLETKIYDSKGSVQSIQDITYSNIVGHLFKVQIDVTNLTTGIYYIRIANQEVKFTKFIKY